MFSSLISILNVVISLCVDTINYVVALKESLSIFLSTTAGYEMSCIFISFALVETLFAWSFLFIDRHLIYSFIRIQLSNADKTIFCKNGLLPIFFYIYPRFLNYSYRILTLTFCCSLGYFSLLDGYHALMTHCYENLNISNIGMLNPPIQNTPFEPQYTPIQNTPFEPQYTPVELGSDYIINYQLKPILVDLSLVKPHISLNYELAFEPEYKKYALFSLAVTFTLISLYFICGFK